MEKLSTKLRVLYTEQEERRRNMQIYHQVTFIILFTLQIFFL